MCLHIILITIESNTTHRLTTKISFGWVLVVTILVRLVEILDLPLSQILKFLIRIIHLRVLSESLWVILMNFIRISDFQHWAAGLEMGLI